MAQKPGVSSENYVETLPADVRKRYREKTSVIQLDPYELSTSDFSADFRQWPDLSYVDMVYFLIFQHSFYTREQLRNVKSLDAYEMQQDGWVRELFHKEINGIHLIKSKVRHSMRIRDKPLDTWVIMRPDGSVDSAHCKCMAGLDECCSHVAAVLFTLESATKARSQASVTDAPAYWMFPTGPRLDTPYKRVKEMDFQSATKKRKLSLTNTDCQPPEENDLEESNFLDTIPSPTKHEEDSFLAELNKCLPTSAVLSLSDRFCENFIPKTQMKCWPVDLGNLYSSENDGLEFSDLLKKCEATDISVSKTEINFLESETRKQSDSPFWFKYRIGRVTASNFYAVSHTNTNNPSMSLLRKLSNSDEYARKVFTSAATEWGKRKEDTARKSYVAQMEVKHQNFKCVQNGLILSEEFPQFGASPDGLLTCDCCGEGCLEIKCPYTCKDSSSIKIGWLEDNDGKLQLKKQHPYYYQIQMSLFVTNRHYCDLFVWSPNASHMERITRDQELWNEMSKKALEFHAKCLMPELLGHHFTQKQVLKPIQATSVVSHSSATDNATGGKKYCVCGGTDDGRKMIFCESENCSKQWFHMACIKMKRVPKGKWLCKDCKA